ncbi:MAG: YafY family protein [Bacteroidia bacterium]
MKSNPDISRLSRLAAMLTLLLSRRLVTSTFLAERFGVSVRTIYRDIRTLESAGVPIVTEEGRGYSIMEGYKLPPVMFTEEEALALITTEQIILRNKDSSLRQAMHSAINKIRAVLNEGSQSKAELLLDRMFIDKQQGGPETSQYLLTLQMALTAHKVVRLHYKDREGNATERFIEPFAIYNSQEEDWTVVAHCRLRGDFRSFRLDRMVGVQMMQEEFAPHALTLEQYVEKYQRRRDP